MQNLKQQASPISTINNEDDSQEKKGTNSEPSKPDDYESDVDYEDDGRKILDTIEKLFHNGNENEDTSKEIQRTTSVVDINRQSRRSSTREK